jgi:hypothetical protein
MEHTFKKSVIIEIDYDSQSPEGFAFESYSGNANISYVAAIELREWGIKDICLFMSDQTIVLSLDLIDKSSDDGESESYSFAINLKNIESEVDSILVSSSIAPEELQLKLTNIQRVGNEFTADGTGILFF